MVSTLTSQRPGREICESLHPCSSFFGRLPKIPELHVLVGVTLPDGLLEKLSSSSKLMTCDGVLRSRKLQVKTSISSLACR